jgi:SNF2 family DNA or RNA helicase
MGDGSWTWYPPDFPPGVSWDMRLEAVPLVLGWNRALGRAESMGVTSVRVAEPRPEALSVAIPRGRVSARSFVFREPAVGNGQPAAGSRPPAVSDRHTARCPLPAARFSSATRIRPPQDVIKLEDRLHYLLQPPLELLLASRSLEFPCLPFAYQLEGVAFLYPRQAAILADEMGLGKSMQAITAIRLLLRSGELRRVAVVCPKPLVTNWQREFGLWAPEIPVLVIEGDQARRHWQWRLEGMPVKIANYELLPRDREVFEAPDAGGQPQVRFDLVVLDESQRIKNRAAATSQAVRALARGRSWALTGTPVENSSEDLVGIFEFLAPGLLPSGMRPGRMGRAVSDYVLRRTKDQGLVDLPPKLLRDAELELTPEQQASYHLAKDQGVRRLAGLGESAQIGHVFELVLRLKQICNFDPATGASAKLERLEADLEEVVASGRKALVFSQWVETLSELARRLRRFGPLEYHGRVPSARRDAVLRQFREDTACGVLLMSYGAGGVGLNLPWANYVFLFDRWWNPAVEDQAINRAHRLGGSLPVTVTRFLTLETIEERINRILEQKRELFDTIFSGTTPCSRLGLSQQELFGLFDLKYPAGPIKLVA